jgi:uncharacterized LabA/DUF88 family protein
VGEDQADDNDEETPVVDSLLSSRDKQVPSKSGQDEQRDAASSPPRKGKKGIHAKFPAPPHFSIDTSTRVATPLHSRAQEPTLPMQRQAGGSPLRGCLPDSEVQRPSPPIPVPQGGADPTAIRLNQVERQLKEGIVTQIENVVGNLLAGPIKQKLVAEITASLETGAVQEVIKRFKLFFTAQVKEVVKAEVKNEVKAEVSKELRAEFQKEIIDARQVTSRLAGFQDNLRKLVGEDIKKAMMDDLRLEFSSMLGQARRVGKEIKDNIDPLKKEIKSELKAEIKNDIEQKIRNDLPALFRQEIKDELVREISDDIGNPLKRELASEISESVEDDVKAHVRRYMKRQARLAVMNAGSEHPVHLVIIDFNNLWAIANKVTTRLPNIKRLLGLLRKVLREYDDHFVPQRISGHVYASKYHEIDVNRVLTTKLSDDPELEQFLKQFQLEIQSEKKMNDNGQDQKYRDVDVMMATRAALLFSNSANKVASITIVSGDGDFNPVVDAAKQAGIYTIVFSFKENLATSLKKKADAFYHLNKPSKFDENNASKEDP